MGLCSSFWKLFIKMNFNLKSLGVYRDKFPRSGKSRQMDFLDEGGTTLCAGSKLCREGACCSSAPLGHSIRLQTLGMCYGKPELGLQTHVFQISINRVCFWNSYFLSVNFCWVIWAHASSETVVTWPDETCGPTACLWAHIFANLIDLYSFTDHTLHALHWLRGLELTGRGKIQLCPRRDCFLAGGQVHIQELQVES